MNVATRLRAGDAPGADHASLAGRLTLLGTQMLKLAGEISRAAPDEAAGLAELPAANAALALLAEEAYQARRRRARHLPARLLGEPAWDILLKLYIASGRGQVLSVSNACRAADAPTSTALRWLHHLAAEGLVERSADETDARRHHVRLTGLGIERMTAYLAESRADLTGESGFDRRPRQTVRG